MLPSLGRSASATNRAGAGGAGCWDLEPAPSSHSMLLQDLDSLLSVENGPVAKVGAILIEQCSPQWHQALLINALTRLLSSETVWIHFQASHIGELFL